MEFLGVGPTELFFIILIAIIFLGPKDMAKTGGQIGAWLNKFIHSDTWKTLRKTSDDLRNLPTQLMREENLKKFLETEGTKPEATDQPKRDAWTGRAPLRMDPAAGSASENQIIVPTPSEQSASPVAAPAKRKAAAPRAKTSSVKKKNTIPATTRVPRKKSNG